MRRETFTTLRNLPSVDEILRDPEFHDFVRSYNRQIIVGLIRDELERWREILRREQPGYSRQEISSFLKNEVKNKLQNLSRGSITRVINGTGVILHTNLGRAVLSLEAIENVLLAVQGYSNLEMDLDTGERGSRYLHVEEIIKRLVGCEGVLVVNNNAAAVLLVLNTLARDREVIVARGQLVEIGGSFRIPEIMKLSGARLVEVGTTNKTYTHDYEQAINESTALLLMVHTSNYRVVGFTHEVSLRELRNIGEKYRLPVVYDLGSGTMMDFSPWGLEPEPTVRESLAQGADIVTFSGDKLLGGPQAGIIVGKKKYLDQMKRNNLLRALRVDKMTIAALCATLGAYLKSDVCSTLPVLNMLTSSVEELRKRAEGLKDNLLQELSSHDIEVRVVEVSDRVGGGAFPTQELKGYAVEIKSELKAELFAYRLRQGTPPLVARVQDEALLVSVRTLLPGDELVIPKLVKESLGGTDKERG